MVEESGRVGGEIMLVIIYIVSLFIAILVVGKISIAIKFKNRIKELFAVSKKDSGKVYKTEQILGLPNPVKRYFQLVMKDGQPYINNARLLHDGQFKTGLKKKWINIKGEQYFTTNTPGFIWKGTTTFFTASDMYIGNNGRLVVSLLSLINIVDAKGEKYNQGELLRWLSESVWFPTNLLPRENLQWTAIDDKTAKISFNYNTMSLYFIVSFNDVGEIEQLKTQRFMDNNNLETWICKVSKYQQKNNVLVPTKAEAIWKVGKRNFSYAKFNVLKLEYDKPVKY